LVTFAQAPPDVQTLPRKEIVPATKNPVVLVHGIKDDARKMQRMARYLRREGWTAYTVTLAPSWGQVGLDELARQLAAFVDETFPRGEKFDLVAFSMGGLVSRYYVQRLGGIERVERFVTISSPHNGTWMAWLIPNPGCRQMRPQSDFLRDLNNDIDTLDRLQFTSIWTPLDLTIVPPKSSCVRVGRAIKLWMPAHPLMVLHPRAWHLVADVLGSEPLNSPTLASQAAASVRK
jgi:triacylglycerol lipase